MHRRSIKSKHMGIMRKFALGIGIIFPLYTISAYATETSSINNITILSYTGGTLENGTFYAGSDAGCQVAFSVSESVSSNNLPASIIYTIGGSEYNVAISGPETTLPLPANQSGTLSITYRDGISQVSRTLEYIVSENGAPVISATDTESGDMDTLSFTIEDTSADGSVISGINDYHCYLDGQVYDTFTIEEQEILTLENGVTNPSKLRLTLTLPDSDSHTVYINAADKCGNTGEYTFNIEGEELSTEDLIADDNLPDQPTNDAESPEETTTEEDTTEEITTEEITSEEEDEDENIEIVSVLLPTDFTMLMYKNPNESNTLVESQDIPFINTGNSPVTVNITGVRFEANDDIAPFTPNLSITLKQHNKEDYSFTISEGESDIFYSITLAPSACDASSLLDKAGRWNPLGDVTSGDYATLRIKGDLGNGNWNANDISVHIIFEFESISDNASTDSEPSSEND